MSQTAATKKSATEIIKVKVNVTQSCPTLWDLKDYTVHGIFQARILGWVAFPFSRGSSKPSIYRCAFKGEEQPGRRAFKGGGWLKW